jgi:hypothetical protein
VVFVRTSPSPAFPVSCSCSSYKPGAVFPLLLSPWPLRRFHLGLPYRVQAPHRHLRRAHAPPPARRRLRDCVAAPPAHRECPGVTSRSDLCECQVCLTLFLCSATGEAQMYRQDETAFEDLSGCSYVTAGLARSRSALARLTFPPTLARSTCSPRSARSARTT